MLRAHDAASDRHLEATPEKRKAAVTGRDGGNRLNIAPASLFAPSSVATLRPNR
jgi:hypothetical protein